MKAFRALTVLILATLGAHPSPRAATTTAAESTDSNLHNYLQVLRSDFNSFKVDLVNSIMKLSDEDAKKFWPIYRAYEKALGDLAVTRAELIRDFVQSHGRGALDDAKAKDIAKRWFSGQRRRLRLLEQYHAKIEKALSPLQAGQFLQIENQIGLFIDVAIASEMPVVGQQP
ncbi:MAG: hypothetical protein AB7O66_20480 [Limisphaerales bacterium]